MKQKRPKGGGRKHQLLVDGIPLGIVCRVEEIAARIKKGRRVPRPHQWSPLQDPEAE